MTRIRGCEEFAAARSMVAEFWTITTPSRYHAQRMVGTISEPNPQYVDLRPDAGRQYLNHVGALWRAAVQRRGLDVFGLRVAEPHHDATPHWHMLLFGAPRDVRHARRLMKWVYALRDCPDERGAKAHRFSAEPIDPAKGDAAGYVAKYVSKNIDAEGVGCDLETGRSASKMVKRADAWAAAWGFRQFQFFGTPNVTTWRALRKVDGVVSDTNIEAARVAADAGDWCAYMETMRVGPVSIRVEPAGRLNSYGEEAAPVPVAFVSMSGSVPIIRRNFAVRWGVLASPRTRVNNCTRPAGAALQPVIDSWVGIGQGSGARYCASTLNRRF
jgi:hypothetical protein